MTAENRKKILLIDDDSDIVSMVRAWLPANECMVVGAGNGKEGLEKFEQENPDLILLDIMMPEMDGYEFCERFSEINKNKDTPIVFLTGQTDEKSKGRALALGAVGYLTKPVTKQDLITAVQKGLEIGERWRGITRSKHAPRSEVEGAPSFAQFKDFLRKQKQFEEGFFSELKRITSEDFCRPGDRLGLSPEHRGQLIAAFTNLEFLSYVDSEQIELGLLSPSFCIKNAVVPIRRAQGAIYFLMANPFDLATFDILKRLTLGGEPLRLAIASARTIRYLFGIHGITREFGPEETMSVSSVELKEEAKGLAQPTIAATHSIIASAISQRASDIHVEPKKNHFDVRFRVDGEMKNIYAIEKELGLQIITRLKALAGMDIAQRRRPQDGVAEFRINEKSFKFRFATTATPFGESIIVRILDPNIRPKKLEELGMTQKQAELMTSFSTRGSGFVLVVGPTGSGKTTTVYSLVNLIDCRLKSVMTVEDPVEYWIPYANQQQVNEKAGMTFEAVLKSSVRQDPDILFLGEVREGLSAKTAFDFTSTGHLTIATLHTSNATTAIFRLERLGVLRSIMADTILGIVAQKLLKKVCGECAVIEPPTEDEVKMMKEFSSSDIPQKVAHPRGCIRCNQTGYFGRVAVYEIIEFDPVVEGMVRGDKSIIEIRKVVRERGCFLMADHALEKIKNLEISPQEAFQKVFSEETLASDVIYGGKSEAAAAPEAPKDKQEPVSKEASLGGRILLVDDDPDSQSLIRRILENRGYEVVTAGDGVEALILIGKEKFDLIISDINMPNLDGVVFMNMLQEKGIDVPIAFLTGDRSIEMEQKCLGSGAVDYFKKPIDKNILILKVQGLLRKKH